MRIAYLHYLFGRQDGTRDRTRHFLDAIRGLGHQVEMRGLNLAPVEPAAADGVSPPLWLRLRGTLKRHLGRYLHDPKDIFWNLRYLRRGLAVLRQLEPDVVIVRPMSLLISMIAATRRLGLPLVLEVHAPSAERRQQAHYAHLPWIDTWAERYRLRRADAITTVSSSLRDHLAERYTLPHDKFKVVHNGADPKRFHPQGAKDPEMSQALAGGPVIGFTGSFQAWHGAALLARMVREVARVRPEARFLFVGDGPGASELRTATAELGERAIFTGWLDHARMPGLVSTLDIGILPESDFYRCPLKLLEWMAAGLAVVVPRYAPLHELIEEDVSGLFFAPGDEEGLIRAVLRLVDEPELRQRLGRAATERVATSLTWPDSARSAVAACELAIARRRAAIA